jgi:hypothetical protein
MSGTEGDAWGPGEFLRLVAEELIRTGLDARFATCEESHHITVGGLAGVRGEIAPGDRYGSVVCQYWPETGTTWTAVDAVNLTESLLTGDSIRDSPRLDRLVAAGFSLLSAAGQELKARGFDVWLEVVANQVDYEAVPELMVQRADGHGNPQILIASDGSVTWTGRYPAVDTASAAATVSAVTAVLIRPLACGVLRKAAP